VFETSINWALSLPDFLKYPALLILIVLSIIIKQKKFPYFLRRLLRWDAVSRRLANQTELLIHVTSEKDRKTYEIALNEVVKKVLNDVKQEIFHIKVNLHNSIKEALTKADLIRGANEAILLSSVLSVSLYKLQSQIVEKSADFAFSKQTEDAFRADINREIRTLYSRLLNHVEKRLPDSGLVIPLSEIMSIITSNESGIEDSLRSLLFKCRRSQLSAFNKIEAIEKEYINHKASILTPNAKEVVKSEVD
tara:strand:- start:1500 stop:2249 length:750 start_codon:yes stop_codon:yes gene_type:complete